MWPTISNINRTIESTIKSYSTDSMKASNLNAWIRVYSGATTDSNQGLIMQSNTDFKLFSAAGEGDSIYGTTQSAGVIGRDWNGKPVIAETGRGFRPSPVITSFNSKEGQDQISRTCDFSITCFSLQQLEKIQTYFMEPGYSVAVEWGWNTVNSAEGLVNTKNGPGGILKEIADTTLNNGSLSAKRFNTNGEYDIFLGFIVGSTVSNDGENFKVDVKLRGTPSLPTYLQSHNRITKTEENTSGTVDAEKSKTGFGPNELINADVAKRRFKAMFNELPSFRQTLAVKKLEDTANINDYINFDKVITDSIDVFLNQTKGFIFKSRQTSIKVVGEDIGGEVEIDKEKLFSQNRYIRFGLAIDILNEIGSLEEYKIGDKRVSFKLDINNSVIGAFPNMFSTKATKLIITGKIPDFSIYFLNSAEVSQNSNGNLADKQPKEFPGFDNFVQFVENKNLTEFGLRENAGYYGYLKNLFVNFDMFKSKIEQKNKTIREILLDILNEMSSAVNGFWNYQIVESEFKKSNETATNELREIAPFVAAPQQQTFNSAGSGAFGFGRGVNTPPTVSNSTGLNLKSGDIVITVIDENWIGQNPQPDPTEVISFEHNGIGSPFLNSTLDISIPSDKANQIIAKRLGSDSQPDSANIKLGGLFNAQTDLFLPKSDTTETDNTTEQTVADTSVDETVLTPTEENRLQEIGNEIGALTRDNLSQRITFGAAAGTVEENNKRKRILEVERDKIRQRVKTAKEAEKTAADAAKEAARGRLTTFLDKIDIVPIPTIQTQFDTKEFEKIKSLINTKLCIFCYDDTDFFDAMKNHYFKKNEGSSLSHPLPIKYSFTILGNSGIRRGDTFKITGIPQKYADNGIFQVTEVEHSLSGMTWETSVTGQYRQIK